MRTGTTYQLEVERDPNMSDHGYNYKMRAGTTYRLDVEREGNVSDHGCYYKQEQR
jgi:hypothetical protein